MMRWWSTRDAELHGYSHPCPVCGRVEDTPGPCSTDCEDILTSRDWERGVPYPYDPDDQED